MDNCKLLLMMLMLMVMVMVMVMMMEMTTTPAWMMIALMKATSMTMT